ncbi:hypothetical protein L7F22_025145 [Adiantum nelumboides]|nr:hypothetical protein [Adiantum nelumboides]
MEDAGLPNELAVRCLLPLPSPLLRSVNRRWRRLLFCNSFFRSLRARQSTALFVCLQLPHVHHDDEELIPDYLLCEIAVESTGSIGNLCYDQGLGFQRHSVNRHLSWDDLLNGRDGCRLISRLSAREGKKIFQGRGGVWVGLGNWVLLLGGWDFDTNQGRASVDALDRTTGSWHQRACMITPRASSFKAVTYKDRYLFVFGGCRNPDDDNEEYLQEAEVYDCALDRWSPIASIPVPMDIFASFLY